MLTIGLPVHSASKAAKAAAAVEQSVQPQKPVKPVQQHVAADESKPFVPSPVTTAPAQSVSLPVVSSFTVDAISPKPESEKSGASPSKAAPFVSGVVSQPAAEKPAPANATQSKPSKTQKTQELVSINANLPVPAVLGASKPEAVFTAAIASSKQVSAKPDASKSVPLISVPVEVKEAEVAIALPTLFVSSPASATPSGFFAFLGLISPKKQSEKKDFVQIDIPVFNKVEGARQDEHPAKTISTSIMSVVLPKNPPIEKSVSGTVTQKISEKPQQPVPASSVTSEDIYIAEPSITKIPLSSKQSASQPKAAPFVSGVVEASSVQKTAAVKKPDPDAVPEDEEERKHFYDRKLNELLQDFPAQKDEQSKPVGAKAPIVMQSDAANSKSSVTPPVKSRKEIEAESDQILQDILPPASERVSRSDMELEPSEVPRRRIYSQPVESEPSESEESDEPAGRRRLYARQNSIRVIASREVSETDEFAEIISDIYSQLKTSARGEGSADSITRLNMPPSQKPQQRQDNVLDDSQQEKFAELETDLFGEVLPKKSAGVPQAKGGLFDQLSEIGAVEGGRPPSFQSASPVSASSDMEFVHIGNEEGLGCPTCHQRNSRIVFCPYCGSGMCTNCSPNVRVDLTGFAYTCPKCGEEVHIKKKIAVPA
jgi:DNA-directed RNA polymerase subunit RPC12/RpoP